MNKRRAKIEALRFAAGVLSDTQVAFYYSGTDLSDDEVDKVQKEIKEIAIQLEQRADRLDKAKGRE